MPLLDANIFLRFLTNDDPKKAKKCFDLFDAADNGQLELRTCEAVVAEVVYVLASRRLYNLSRGEIVQKFLPVLQIKGLRIPSKNVILAALKMYGRTRLDFEDALLVNFLKHYKESVLYSYDTDFDKVAGIKRLMP